MISTSDRLLYLLGVKALYPSVGREEFKTDLQLNAEILKVLQDHSRSLVDPVERIVYGTCATCGERGTPIPIEGGVAYAYPCTSEIVVEHGGKVRILKACPDIGRVARGKTILSRKEGG